jgi:hypothetical protein
MCRRIATGRQKSPGDGRPRREHIPVAGCETADRQTTQRSALRARSQRRPPAWGASRRPEGARRRRSRLGIGGGSAGEEGSRLRRAARPLRHLPSCPVRLRDIPVATAARGRERQLRHEPPRAARRLPETGRFAAAGGRLPLALGRRNARNLCSTGRKPSSTALASCADRPPAPSLLAGVARPVAALPGVFPALQCGPGRRGPAPARLPRSPPAARLAVVAPSPTRTIRSVVWAERRLPEPANPVAARYEDGQLDRPWRHGGRPSPKASGAHRPVRDRRDGSASRRRNHVAPRPGAAAAPRGWRRRPRIVPAPDDAGDTSVTRVATAVGGAGTAVRPRRHAGAAATTTLQQRGDDTRGRRRLAELGGDGRTRRRPPPPHRR